MNSTLVIFHNKPDKKKFAANTGAVEHTMPNTIIVRQSFLFADSNSKIRVTHEYVWHIERDI